MATPVTTVARRVILCFSLCLLALTQAAYAESAYRLDDFLRRDKFGQIRISPDGKHFAATVPTEDDANILAVISLEDMKMTGYFKPVGNKIVVADFWWANDQRLLISVGEKFGQLDRPQLTGEIYAMDADGKRQKLLVGQRAGVPGAGRSTDRDSNYVAAFVIDTLPDEERFVLISTFSLLVEDVPFTKVERMDVVSGRRLQVARTPVQRAEFVTDPSGQVRFASGSGADNRQKTYYRASDKSEWVMIGDEAESGGLAVIPLGFSPDGRTAYVRKEERSGPDGVYAMDPDSLEMTLVARSEFADPAQLVSSLDGRGILGAMFYEGASVVRFFDEAHPDVRLFKSIQASFPGHYVGVDSTTADGKLAVLHVFSDRAPANYFLFDVENKRASHLVARRDWIDPETTASMHPITVEARDGLSLHGYLTIPHGKEAKNLPLVVNPHGGPFFVADRWGFDTYTQMLAAHGYAVLQINFRGSAGYGAAFEAAGVEQWGHGMIDDITDAVKWTVAEGIADPDRICIYGGSYGGYAALMSVAREPDLYRCAVGYVGIYDMPMMFGKGDIQQRRSGLSYLREAFGDVDLASISPTRMANRIKVPVLLAAGKEDLRAPPEHTEAMDKALRAARVPVETSIVAREGHGFSNPDNERAFYRSLLEFLDRHIGVNMATAANAASGGD